MYRPNIDWGVIKEEEGKQLDSYVPVDDDKKPIGRSGVTVGYGFDLGQHSETDLQRLGLPDELIKRFRPYLGVTGQTALALNAEQPLSITEEEAELLFDKVKSGLSKQVIDEFNRIAWQTHGPETTQFNDLSKSAQTMLMEISYQYGPYGANKTFSHAAAGDWAAVWQELDQGIWDKNTLTRHENRKQRILPFIKEQTQ